MRYPLTLAVLGLAVLLYFAHAYITYIEVRLPLPGERAAPGSPWPMPQEWTKSPKVLTLDPLTFYVASNARSCDIIDKALMRYKNLILIDTKKGTFVKSVPKLEGLQITVKSGESAECGYPKLEDNERYRISVKENEMAVIEAETVWGALRGLETFSQLVYQDETSQGYLINVTEIQDYPRYKYRGLLIDTARHFQPMKVLKANLDAMAYNKFNILHWHLVDDQSFPFESQSFPNLTRLGAYSPRHVYTRSDIAEIIEYARDRGIRVLPEIDTPGHTQAFGKSFPDLLTPCYGQDGKKGTPNHPEHAAYEILNPMINKTYDVFKELFQEVKEVFKDEYIHLGMDEVYYACWNSSPEIKTFMQENGYTEMSQVEQHYVRKTIRNVQDIGYKYVIWQDPIDNDVKAANDTIVQVWKDKYLDSKMDYWENYIAPIAQKGYQMVLSACWYLNYISYGPDWKKYYECDPRNFNGTEKEKDLVIGGEACMWGEYVDGTNILARLWPRASAVAERLWSAASVNDTDSANFRLDQQRCRMLRRGIPAEPILNGFCGDYEWDMNDDNNAEPSTEKA